MLRFEKCSNSNFGDWLDLRVALWPGSSESKHRREMDSFLSEPDRYFQIICYSESPVGFIEASIRNDYVNGVDKSPVVFLEGIYIDPEYRGQGIARALVEKVDSWARQHNIHQMASDALITNLDSHAMHKALGFEETERVVFFRREI